MKIFWKKLWKSIFSDSTSFCLMTINFCVVPWLSLGSKDDEWRSFDCSACLSSQRPGRWTTESIGKLERGAAPAPAPLPDFVPKSHKFRTAIDLKASLFAAIKFQFKFQAQVNWILNRVSFIQINFDVNSVKFCNLNEISARKNWKLCPKRRLGSVSVSGSDEKKARKMRVGSRCELCLVWHTTRARGWCVKSREIFADPPRDYRPMAMDRVVMKADAAHLPPYLSGGTKNKESVDSWQPAKDFWGPLIDVYFQGENASVKHQHAASGMHRSKSATSSSFQMYTTFQAVARRWKADNFHLSFECSAQFSLGENANRMKGNATTFISMSSCFYLILIGPRIQLLVDLTFMEYLF